jgi:hypothetical protein
MGRIGSFFNKLGQGIKSFGSRAIGGLSHIAPKIVKGASFISGALSHMPGAIGTAAGAVHKGLDFANKAISALPSSRFKDKLEALNGKVNDTVNKVEPTITNAAREAKVVGDTAGKVINAIKPHII